MTTDALSSAQLIFPEQIFSIHVCKQVVPGCGCSQLQSKTGEEKMISKLTKSALIALLILTLFATHPQLLEVQETAAQSAPVGRDSTSRGKSISLALCSSARYRLARWSATREGAAADFPLKLIMSACPTVRVSGCTSMANSLGLSRRRMVVASCCSTPWPIKRSRSSIREPRWRFTTGTPRSSLANSDPKREPVLLESAKNSRKRNPALPDLWLLASACFLVSITEGSNPSH
jgi:hypothetical protein